MTIHSYIENIAKDYVRGIATEHTFRPALKTLIEELIPEIAATNEPKRIECGAPDYVITRKDIPVGYIEAKDIGVDLDGKNLKEQFDRYRDALDNLVFTDYLDFRFYLNGEQTTRVKIAEIQNGRIVPLPENFEQFASLIKEFCSRSPQTIKSSKKLAEMMAEKAKILAYIIKNALDEDIAAGAVTDLTNQMKAFKDILIHDIDAKAFADIYAQTIAYGMFAARLHDDSLDTFSRQEAAEKIPKTNPFLRKLFQFIAAFDLDTRIDWIVDALADLFRATDIAAILTNFGKSTQTHDPIMHFYETFLAEYDPKLRKSRGVFYTPEPVVDFIVRAVDDILKSEFNLPNGLADTSKTKIKVDVQGKIREQEVHKVQILDPATGTGTFLATVIKHIYKGFENQQGVWNQYVDEHLIPRLNGFELLMASYAMAHLKLDLLLSETGYKENKDRRFQIYLTNALEEYHPDTGTLFASWLSTEANEANHIKRDTPVMVVIGNPPYAAGSSNKGKWITDLLEKYKAGVNDINKNALSDDYVKFIRLGHYFVEKNGEGILAYISNNSFLDGSTHRQMRKELLSTFDKIFILNLRGDLKRIDASLNDDKDENVFDIQQGVSINIFVKNTKRTATKATLSYCDYFGTRESKYKRLTDNHLETIDWQILEPDSEYAFFMPKDFSSKKSFDELIPLNDLFKVIGGGIKFRKDNLLVKNHFSAQDVEKMLADINTMDTNQFLIRYDFSETADWTLSDKKRYFVNGDTENIKPVTYRPFEKRFTYYPLDTINEIITRGDSRKGFMRNVQDGNIFLIVTKGNRQLSLGYFWLCTDLFDLHVLDTAGDSLQSFPLYIFPADNSQPTLDGRVVRTPNLNSQIVDKIATAIGETFANEDGDLDGTFAPIDILDYIYAVLHSPSYREKYKEFLKIDFPRVPYPKDAATFWQLVTLGGELRQIHLLESPVVSRFITSFNVGGDNIVEKPEYKNGSVYFNDTQYFANVPEIAWNFYIGGYQPAQKWLKDRKGRHLGYDEIQHYQKIIVALTETDRLMKEIDRIDLTD